MSDIIRLLPDSVANQIAAGEVIQRPASVVKELVENAIDAGAHTIQVIIVDAGRTSIQVIDDGKGMSSTDARLSFERHATSKIQQADDLFALHTMGFRGEALASIAAVAQVELVTRLAGEEIGTQLSISGSKVTAQQPVSCPTGSNFKVENLFYNVPARRKFLKSNATELNNILTAFERIVLVYPDIHFSLYSNGAELMNLRPGTLLQRITDVFGRQYSQNLLTLQADTMLCRISGFVAKPEAARKKTGHEYFFVNGRYMRHPYFHKAVLSAYDRMIQEGMQVPYFIYFDVKPEDIDVNIHPTKTEIKFENEQTIWQILLAAVRDAIGKFCDTPTIDFDTVGKPDIPVYDPANKDVRVPQPQYNADYNPFKSAGAPGHSSVPSGWETLYEGLTDSEPASDSGRAGASPDTDDLFGPSAAAAALSSENLLAEKAPTHYQYKGRYIMTAVKSGLMIIDQHRASVRVLFDHYAGLNTAGAASQRLLFAETLQLSPSEAVVMDSVLPELSALGFDLSNLGGNTFAVNGIPVGLEGLNPIALLQQLIADAADHGASLPSGISLSVAESVHLSLARAAAIPYGQILSDVEMDSLINSLFACSVVNYTPDGKTVLSILPQTDIDRLLG